MASYTRQALLVLKRIAIVIGIAIAFSLGLLSAIYLSLRSSETRAVAAHVLPLVAIVLTAMLTQAFSSGFDTLYAMRVFVG